MGAETLCMIMLAPDGEKKLKESVQKAHSFLEEKGASSLLVVGCCEGWRDAQVLQEMGEENDWLDWLESEASTPGERMTELYRYASDKADFILGVEDIGALDSPDMDVLWGERGDCDLAVSRSDRQKAGSLRKVSFDHMIRRYFHVKLDDVLPACLLIRRFHLENYLAILPEKCPAPTSLLTALCTIGRERVKWVNIRLTRPRDTLSLPDYIALPGVTRYLGRRFSPADEEEQKREIIRYLGPLNLAKNLYRKCRKKLGLSADREITPFDLTQRKIEGGKARDFLEFIYFYRQHVHLDLSDPVTYCEKIQWLKLYDATPLKTKLTDKYRAKEYIAEKVGDKYNVPVQGVWERPEDIDYDSLTYPFVIKTNHSWRTNIGVWNKEKLDVEANREKFTAWLKDNFAFVGCEMQYYNIKPLIFAEKGLPPFKNGSEEYKLHCIDGHVEFIHNFIQREEDGELVLYEDLYSREWERLPWAMDLNVPDTCSPPPKELKEMVWVAETLSKGIPTVRVDFYDVDGKIYVGELTFTTSSGFCHFSSLAYDIALGRKIKLPPMTPPPEGPAKR